MWLCSVSNFVSHSTICSVAWSTEESLSGWTTQPVKQPSSSCKKSPAKRAGFPKILMNSRWEPRHPGLRREHTHEKKEKKELKVDEEGRGQKKIEHSERWSYAQSLWSGKEGSHPSLRCSFMTERQNSERRECVLICTSGSWLWASAWHSGGLYSLLFTCAATVLPVSTTGKVCWHTSSGN